MFKRVSGTKDILPDQVGWWQHIEGTSRDIFAAYNYLEIRPPLIEEAALFSRSLGEWAEIVQKQMFLIKREEDVFALRPEGTASIVRAYIENSLDKTTGFVKLYYMGPMFRAERPQKGRLRQFHHIGCEAIGSYGPDIDVEVIALADNLLKAYGIQGYTIVLNSLGCTEDKKALNTYLKENLNDKLDSLCADCKDRFQRNILRILDCKNEACQSIVKKLDLESRHLCGECTDHFFRVRQGLDALSVAYQVVPGLVRGLDYYSRTVFEIKHPGLGPQQDALGAGGRYDGLVKELGGAQLGAIGFAFGVERLSLASASVNQSADTALVYVIGLGDEAKKESFKILARIRALGFAADTDYEGKSLKGALRKANDLKARLVIIIGDDELKEKAVMLKDMQTGAQEKVAWDELVTKLKQ